MPTEVSLERFYEVARALAAPEAKSLREFAFKARGHSGAKITIVEAEQIYTQLRSENIDLADLCIKLEEQTRRRHHEAELRKTEKKRKAKGRRKRRR